MERAGATPRPDPPGSRRFPAPTPSPSSSRRLPNLLARLREIDSPYLKDLEWLTAQRDRGAFVSMPEYCRKIAGDAAEGWSVGDRYAVTLEISALQYFPWLIAEARQAIDRQELMPGRYIRVRKMKGQEGDQGDLLAVAAAMQIAGATHVETLDTRGTDGSNVHLGGPATIAGYSGGVGQPNDYPIKWADEYLHYYTSYGVEAEVRKALSFEEAVRFEHHITETWKSIVRQPYNRRGELVEIAPRVANVSAKHEGGEVEVEQEREHPSDVLDYFRDKAEVEAAGEMPLLRNYLDKHDAVNRTARALVEHGVPVVAARSLHKPH